MDFKATSIKKTQRSRRAFTLVEMMWGLAITGVVAAAVCSAIAYSGRSFQGVNNYIDLDKKSRNSLDVMMNDIRSALRVTGYDSNQLNIVDASGINVQYSYSSSKGKLLRIRNSKTNNLLSGCTKLEFAMYQRAPQTADAWLSTTNIIYCKLVQVNWTCSRTLYAAGTNRFDTESVQTAKIVIRNEPSL